MLTQCGNRLLLLMNVGECMTETRKIPAAEGTPLRILQAGVDTLLVNFKLAGEDGKPNGEHLSDEAIAQLDAWQAVARKEHADVPTSLLFRYQLADGDCAQTVLMRPHGHGVWSWLLHCDDVRLAFAPGSLNGGVFCQARFSSHLLWTLGPEQAIITLEAMLYDFLGRMIYQQASEIHLCVDIQGFDFSQLAWERCFVSRVVRMRARSEVPCEEEQAGGLSPADLRSLEEKIREQGHEGSGADEVMCFPCATTVHRRLATLDFGSHGSAISAQLYHKTKEIKAHHKDWFETVWAGSPAGYDPALPVWRLEFRFKRKFLAEFDLNEAFETLGRLEALWRYATFQWLRMVDLEGVTDSNPSRWPTHPVWQRIQEAFTVVDEAASAPAALMDEATCVDYLLAAHPEQLLEEALGVLEGVEQQPTEHEETHAVAGALLAARHAFVDEPVEVLRALAREAVDCLRALDPAALSVLLARLAPAPAPDLRKVLVRRARRLGRKRVLLTGLVGYASSYAAVLADEELTWVGGKRPPTAKATAPNLFATMLTIFRDIRDYHAKKHQSHTEMVWLKRLAAGFMTAIELAERRQAAGLELGDDGALLDAFLYGYDYGEAPHVGDETDAA